MAETLIKRLRNGPPADCCTTGRGNGIRANPCPAGHWAATGARTASRCGPTTAWIADVSKDYGFGIAEAKVFIETLADTLGGQPALHPRRLRGHPVLPSQGAAAAGQCGPHEIPSWTTRGPGRAWWNTFQRGLGAVVGYVLPLQHGSWKSGPWPFRGGHMFLLPGDSPAGLRLPLESLPWVSKADFPYDHPLDPMADRGPLPGPSRGPAGPARQTRGRGGRQRAHPARTL